VVIEEIAAGCVNAAHEGMGDVARWARWESDSLITTPRIRSTGSALRPLQPPSSWRTKSPTDELELASAPASSQ